MTYSSDKLDELYLKHNVLTDGLQRVYRVSTFDRRLDMDRTTPIELHFLMSDKSGNILGFIKSFKITSRSWVRMIKEVAETLQDFKPKPLEVLFNFRTDWSSAAIFSKNKEVVNMQLTKHGYYVNVNHTTNHMLWVIQDILRFYCDEDENRFGWLLIHRPPFSEPEEIRKEVLDMRKLDFKDYLVHLNKSEERIAKILKGMDTLNYLLMKSRSVYDNFYLIDDPQTLSNYKSKLLSELHVLTSWNEAQQETARKYLDYFTNYMTELKKEAKKHPISFYIPVL